MRTVLSPQEKRPVFVQAMICKSTFCDAHNFVGLVLRVSSLLRSRELFAPLFEIWAALLCCRCFPPPSVRHAIGAATAVLLCGILAKRKIHPMHRVVFSG